MARNPVHVRDATPEDAQTLVAMWQDNLESSARQPAPTVDSAVRGIGHLALDPEQRLVLAEVDDEVVGVAYLVRSPLSPLHDETAVRVGRLFVRSDQRRRGVGRALLAAAAAWADEKQTAHLRITVSSAARDANRFLARLGFAAIAHVRATSVPVLQERLARFEAVDTDGHVVVERLRTLRRRQASARLTRRVSGD